ncbi:MAG: VOC family protein [Kiritimatiellae bacterium]|jgi:glyoxylase I family protein|nr:VOC family protein [Kiritimatiellia bacterium]
MKIEHLGLNVENPIEMAEWYCDNLGFVIKRKTDAPVHARFIVDSSGQGMIEIYRNEEAPIPDYFTMSPLTLHIAFVADDIDEQFKKLVAAGATVLSAPETIETGDRLSMLRDPWGVPIQLCKRAQSLL